MVSAVEAGVIAALIGVDAYAYAKYTDSERKLNEVTSAPHGSHSMSSITEISETTQAAPEGAKATTALPKGGEQMQQKEKDSSVTFVSPYAITNGGPSDDYLRLESKVEGNGSKIRAQEGRINALENEVADIHSVTTRVESLEHSIIGMRERIDEFDLGPVNSRISLLEDKVSRFSEPVGVEEKVQGMQDRLDHFSDRLFEVEQRSFASPSTPAPESAVQETNSGFMESATMTPQPTQVATQATVTAPSKQPGMAATKPAESTEDAPMDSEFHQKLASAIDEADGDLAQPAKAPRYAAVDTDFSRRLYALEGNQADFSARLVSIEGKIDAGAGSMSPELMEQVKTQLMEEIDKRNLKIEEAQTDFSTRLGGIEQKLTMIADVMSGNPIGSTALTEEQKAAEVEKAKVQVNQEIDARNTRIEEAQKEFLSRLELIEQKISAPADANAPMEELRTRMTTMEEKIFAPIEDLRTRMTKMEEAVAQPTFDAMGARITVDEFRAQIVQEVDKHTQELILAERQNYKAMFVELAEMNAATRKESMTRLAGIEDKLVAIANGMSPAAASTEGMDKMRSQLMEEVDRQSKKAMKKEKHNANEARKQLKLIRVESQKALKGLDTQVRRARKHLEEEVEVAVKRSNNALRKAQSAKTEVQTVAIPGMQVAKRTARKAASRARKVEEVALKKASSALRKAKRAKSEVENVAMPTAEVAKRVAARAAKKANASTMKETEITITRTSSKGKGAKTATVKGAKKTASRIVANARRQASRARKAAPAKQAPKATETQSSETTMVSEIVKSVQNESDSTK